MKNMKFSVEKEGLVNSLGNITISVGKKQSTLPITLNVKLSVKDGVLSLTTTDLDTIITTDINVNSEVNGVITVPAQLFYEIVKKVPERTLLSFSLSEDFSTFEIKYGKSKFKLPFISAENFPVMEQDNAENSFEISSVEFLKIIDKVKFSIINDEARFYLGGMFFHLNETDGKKEFVGVSTDGHRLTIATSSASAEVSEFSPIIVPKKTLYEIKKITEHFKGQVKISLSKTKIMLEAGNTQLISKLLIGTYPEYKRIIPSENNVEAFINRKDLLNNIDRVATIATDKNKIVKIIFDSNNLSIEADAVEGNSGKESMEISYSYPEKISTAFNSKYFMELLQNIDDDEIVITLKDGLKPVIIESKKDKSFKFILMPIRS